MAINKIAHSSFEVERENYISLLRAGQSISDIGWRTYADAAGTSPVDGTGGTPNITWAQNTTAPLSGDADLRMVKDAANRQGQGVSIDFTVSNRHLAKVLQITFDMELISGTYSSGDLRVYIVQDPNGTPTIIEPVGTNIELGIANQRVREIATFQTSPTVTSYRLCVHVSSSSASAYTVDFANFRVWEPQQSIGAVITDWVDFTPVITNGGTTTRNIGKWRRVGSSMEIIIDTAFSGAGAASAIRYNLPAGYSIDTNIITVFSTSAILGTGEWSDVSAAYYMLNPYAVSATQMLLILSGASNDLFGNSLANGDSISLRLLIPIAGWGSSVAMSSDTGDGRVVSMVARNPATISSADATFIFATVDKDTHGTYSSSTGVYTIPISGDYFISTGYIFPNNTVATAIYVSIDNNTLNNNALSYSNSNNVSMNGGRIFSLNAGQTVRLKANQANNGGSNVSSNSYFSINRISAGTQQIAATETIAARYTTDTAQNNNVIKCEDRDFDTHNAYNTTTGKYTVPMSGVYRISGQITNYNSGYLYADIRKNNDVIICRDLIQLSSASYLTASPNLVTKLIAGDTVWLWAYTDGTMQVDTGYRNMFCIERIGL